MNETLTLALAWLAGGLLGAIFFGGLVVDGSQGRLVPPAGALVSRQLLLRMSIVLAGFYFVSGGQWKRLLRVSRRICHGACRRDVADAAVGEKPEPPGSGGPPCALVPTR